MRFDAKASMQDPMSNDEENDENFSDGDDSDTAKGGRQSNSQYYSQAEKRAHHNALERKRRDHIKDSFTSLRDSVPSLQGEKASRAQILKKAAEYIQFMRRKNNSHQQDIDDLKRQNNMLEEQIRRLERARASGNFTPDAVELSVPTGGGAASGGGKSDSSSRGASEESSDNEDASQGSRRSKKLKPNSYPA